MATHTDIGFQLNENRRGSSYLAAGKEGDHKEMRRGSSGQSVRVVAQMLTAENLKGMTSAEVNECQPMVFICTIIYSTVWYC